MKDSSGKSVKQPRKPGISEPLYSNTVRKQIVETTFALTRVDSNDGTYYVWRNPNRPRLGKSADWDMWMKFNGEDPEPPRHCQEDMRLMTPVDDL